MLIATSLPAGLVQRSEFTAFLEIAAITKPEKSQRKGSHIPCILLFWNVGNMQRWSDMTRHETGLCLKRATITNRVFDRLEAEWTAEAELYGDEDYAAPQLDHARRIASEEPPDTNYGVFVLVDGEGILHGLAHFNRACLPRTNGITLRVLWALLAPRYDYEDIKEEESAALIAGLIFASLELCSAGELRANHLKMHLPNRADRRLAAGLVSHLDHAETPTSVAVKGNWLHIDNVSV
ncbi:hypothetical protein [Aquibaculum sediminis]|uniref:hypothetical protein n=1 Tax=Aquibaculum sediminis TaxID=3231907 RepID=UPI0034532E50